jgi:hypothetical protein
MCGYASTKRADRKALETFRMADSGSGRVVVVEECNRTRRADGV